MPGISEFSSAFGADEYLTKSGRRKAKAEEQALDIGQQQFDIAKELYTTARPLRLTGVNALQGYLTSGVLPYALDTPEPERYGLNEFLETGELPTAVDIAPSTALNRDVLERQFTRARESAIAQAPTLGGALASSLTDLEAQRALGVTAIEAQANEATRQLSQQLFGVGLDLEQREVDTDRRRRDALFAAALGLGTGESSTALGGLAGASGTYTNIASLALAESLEKQKRAQEKVASYGGALTGSGAIGGGGGAA